MRADACSCERPGTVEVNGVDFALVGPDGALTWVFQALECRATHIVNHLAAHPTVLARRDSAYRELLNRAALNVADGMGPVWACRAQGYEQPDARVYGPDFQLAVIERGLEHGLRHSFVGGTPASLAAMLAYLRRRFPGVAVAGAVAPPFRAVTEDAVDADLSAVDQHADVLWVGLGTPKQQMWADMAARRAPARVILTVGAAFDFHAGTVRQAPGWMQAHGLEWAYRLAKEPRRLFKRYAVGNVQFAAGVLIDRLRHG